jgi:omega-6 fatty acid desaturase (delta-12 desaturase)
VGQSLARYVTVFSFQKWFPLRLAHQPPAVAITDLQHTDVTLPHYNSQAWTHVRGAAATIDRDLGFIGRHLFHGIAETHVLHHYVSVIPFYNADKVSEAIIPVMGRHYRSNTKGRPVGFVKALYTNFRECQWVEPTEGIGEDMQHVIFLSEQE